MRIQIPPRLMSELSADPSTAPAAGGAESGTKTESQMPVM